MRKGNRQPMGLYDADGMLQRQLFDAKAWSILEETEAWLKQIGRSLFLPIDLIVVLLRAGHDDLGVQLARASRGGGGSKDILPALENLARRVDRELSGEPRLHCEHFSLGFLGILGDALNWAKEAGWDRISEEDLVRVVRWRAEIQESASVRWAIKQLAFPSGENLFDGEGNLRSELFAESAWRVLQAAMRLGADSGMPFLGTPHLLAAFCEVRDSLTWKAAESSGVDPRKLHQELLHLVGSRSPAQAEFTLSRRTMTPRLVRMLTFAAERCEREKLRIAEPHILEGFLEDGGSSLELLRALGIESTLRTLLGDPKVLEAAAVERPEREERSMTTSSTRMLDTLGRDLTREAREGKLPTILGRERELSRVINVLMRQEQRNPLLTGEAGVGKTAIAAALAQKIVEGRVPKRLAGYRVVEINGASLIGGTSYRGDLEARIKALLAEARERVILFVDEAHAVFSPRSGSGQPAEVPNHFKAALASGDIAVIAATTDSEYHRWLEQDPALRRRFERIDIPEPGEWLTRKILETLAREFEKDYEVLIPQEAVDATLELSSRFLPEQRFPDKAKKLLMDAAIATTLDSVAPSEGETDTRDLRAIGERSEDLRPAVTREAVARQVSLKTGLPMDRLVHGETGWWVGLAERLKQLVIGQEAAVEQAARALISGRLRSGLTSGPQAVLVFVGPPAVGKADLARALAGEIFADPRALIRLNMSDFQEGHTISRLIGSPPGYVGYQEEDALVTPLRRRPSSVVLLENFDLAHCGVQDRFFSLFEEGTISDTRGMTADVRHAIFILTVNTPPETEGGRIGFNLGAESMSPREQAVALLDQHAGELAKKLRGYPHEVVLFRSASSDRGRLLAALFEQRLARFRASLLEEYGLQLDLGSRLEAELKAQVCTLKDARELEPFFSTNLVEPVTNELLKGVTGDTIILGSSLGDSGEFESVAGEIDAQEASTPVPKIISSE
ncbi:MAG: ATP-dependent Clp protease ATP-binding subunit [Bradymonadales bacterium]|nr:ATP-dependent Clp protease ATP-binding subunit [Bradymonadales bacterium]